MKHDKASLWLYAHLCLLVVIGGPAVAQQQGEPPSANDPVVEPQLERREVKTPKLDTENFELGIAVGAYSLEDFGSTVVYEISAAYHITEDVFFEARGGYTEVDDSTFRDIGLPIFPNEDEDLYYYNASIGFNIFPGEFFWGSERAFTSHLYVIGGIGNTHFADDDYSTFNIGGGFRILFTDWTALRVDVRDHVFDLDLLGRNETKHNLVTTLGLTVFF